MTRKLRIQQRGVTYNLMNRGDPFPSHPFPAMIPYCGNEHRFLGCEVLTALLKLAVRFGCIGLVVALSELLPNEIRGATFTPLLSFNGTNGANPYGKLVFGRDGNLYGTAAFGGISYNG